MRTRSQAALTIGLFAAACLGIWIVVRESDVPHAEREVPVERRLDEIIEWTTADTDTATDRLIDCLADKREINGTNLHGKAKDIWAHLRAHTNSEITVSAFALHQLSQNQRRSTESLARRIHQLDRASEAVRTADWSARDGNHAYRLLHALAEVHQISLLQQDVIPETQVVIEITSAAGVTRSSVALIVGYVDHRDEVFSQFVSGTTNGGKDQITVTRANIAFLADAIRDSHVNDRSP